MPPDDGFAVSSDEYFTNFIYYSMRQNFVQVFFHVPEGFFIFCREISFADGDGMEALLNRLEQLVWGWPLLLLLLGAGSWMTLRLRLLPFRRLPKALRLVFRRRDKSSGVTAFGALCTALSATIGTGNIVGVATALSLGGPGALFWMELSALTGLSLKYAEGVLSVRFRYRTRQGAPYGGPFAYITLGLGRRFRPLADWFALCGAFAGLCGVGTFVQVGSVSSCLSLLLSGAFGSITVLRLPWGDTVPLAGVLTGLLLSMLSFSIIFGGMQRISRLSAKLVPMMGALYVGCCLWILIRNRAALPQTLLRVLQTAFRPASAGAGLLGVVTAGVSRGVFSNEAGLGTAPLASAAAVGVTPREQGLISMTGTVFDTLLVCTLTGLVILVTGADGVGIGAAMTAFSRGLPFPALASRALVFLILTMFSYTTVLGWSCYGTACLDHLTGGSVRIRKAYLTIYTCTIAAAPFCSGRGIWSAASVCNALMALPNLIALILLSRRVAESSGIP